LHQVGDLIELNVKLRCQKVKWSFLFRNCLGSFVISLSS